MDHLIRFRERRKRRADLVISVSNLSIKLGAFSLQDVSLHVPPGQYAVLMGKTGSGKTSILESICGLRPIGAGRIELAGRDVTRLKPAVHGSVTSRRMGRCLSR